MLSLVSTSVVFGIIWAGALTDPMHVRSVMGLCSVGAALAVFLFRGSSPSLPMLCLFSLLYGLTAGSSNDTGIAQPVKEHDDAADTGMIFGTLAAGRGIGAVSSGPLMENLLHTQHWQGKAKLGCGTSYSRYGYLNRGWLSELGAEENRLCMGDFRSSQGVEMLRVGHKIRDCMSLSAHCFASGGCDSPLLELQLPSLFFKGFRLSCIHVRQSAS